jgi:hypothetical protein
MSTHPASVPGGTMTSRFAGLPPLKAFRRRRYGLALARIIPAAARRCHQLVFGFGPGAIMTSDITDVARTAIAVGSGTLLSRASYRMLIKPRSLVSPPGAPKVYYGMGVVLDNSWVVQNPLFAGYNATMAYLPSKRVAIAVATTLGPKASSSTNYSTQLTAAIGKYLVPQRPPFP